jgi:hypothetical protein
MWYNSVGERYSLDDIDVINAIEKTLLYEALDFYSIASVFL